MVSFSKNLTLSINEGLTLIETFGGICNDFMSDEHCSPLPWALLSGMYEVKELSLIVTVLRVSGMSLCLG